MVSTYAPTDRSHESSKDEFFHDLQVLAFKDPRSGISIFTGCLNAQVGRLREIEAFWETIMNMHRNENEDRLLQYCIDNQLFLSNTNYPLSSQLGTVSYQSEDGNK